MRILSVYGENVNSFYSLATCNNGGGYWQPCGVALISLDNGQLVTVEFNDSSCGDFGRRESFSVEVDGFKWGWNYSDMDGEYSNTDREINTIIDSIGGVLRCNPDDILNLAVHAINIAARYTEYFN